MTLLPPLTTNTQTFYGPTLIYDQIIEPALYTNTQTFYEITVYIYPWHPNCLPGDMTVPTAARQAMTVPELARQAMTVPTAARQPMPIGC